MKVGRKAWLTLVGLAALAAISWAGTQYPEHKAFLEVVAAWVVAQTGLGAWSIAFEDSRNAQANADVETAKHYAGASKAPEEAQ